MIQVQPDTVSAHLELAATICGLIVIPLFLAWRDIRTKQDTMHQENRKDLIVIKTQMEPIWEWWNERIKRANGGNGH